MYNYLIAVLVAVVVVAGTVFWTHRDQLAAAQTDPDTQKLLEQLKSSDRNERVEALIQLGKSDDDLDRIVPAIIEMLPDNDTVVQAAASQALQDLGAKAVPYLKPYLESEDPAKYSYGCEAIRLIGEPAKEYLPLLIQQLQGEDTRRDRSSVGALRGLGEHGLPALDEVIKRLDSSNFHVQYEACRAIAAMGLGAGTWSCFGALFGQHYPAALRATAAALFYAIARGVQLPTKPAIGAAMASTGSFAPALWVGIACALGSAALVLALPRPSKT